MMKMRFVSYLLIFSAVLVPASVRADVKDELQGINREIREKKLLLKKTNKEEKKVSGELVQIDASLKEKEASLQTLQRNLKAVESKIDATQREIGVLQLETEKKQQELRKRLVAAYKGGEAGALRSFFSSESFPQMTENLRYMRAVAQNDRKLLTAYNERITRMRELKSTLEHDANAKERLKGAVEEKKRSIEAEKTEKAQYLGKVRQDKKSYLAMIRELQANARRLQAMVEKLEAAQRKSYTDEGKKRVKVGDIGPPVPDKGFGALKGRLSLPARGEVTDRFGRHKHPEFNSYTVNNGITISAPPGADIHAVYDGKVIFADYFKGYGNMMIVDHGGGFFSLYAHASRLLKKTGAEVKRNELVASVGDVDSTKGPHLYFEIRYQGKPVDPMAWFR